MSSALFLTNLVLVLVLLIGLLLIIEVQRPAVGRVPVRWKDKEQK
ncbi:MAG: hypothetical protein R3191_01620 [Anaerolineales bacterium]|nr:hypothetical protein [Anaerolineales bacterium]